MEKKISMVEAYTVAYEKANYHAAIEKGNRESVLAAREQEITDNLVRYVGEYRLGVTFDEYYYQVNADELSGERFLISKEPGPIRDIYRRAIKVREDEGLSVKREVAECLGFEKLEKQLLDAPVGTMSVWVSPPGEGHEGYGGYSFTFLSQVEEIEGQRRIRMVPYRNEKTIDEHNSYLSEITGEKVNLKKDTDFLSTPFIVEQSENIQSPEDMLLLLGEKESFDASWREQFLIDAQPLLQGFLYLVRENATDEELVKAKNALENYAIAYRAGQSIPTKIDISESFYTSALWEIEKWGAVAPPVVRGSCGPTGESASTPMEFQLKHNSLDSDRYGERTFDCPTCKKENVRPFNKLIPKCQHCGSDKVAC